MSEEKKKIERVSPYVKNLIKETGKSEKEIKELWQKAKEIAVDTYGIDEKDFRPKHYKFMVDTVKEMLGLNEKVALVVDFVNSDKSAKEFIQETVIGADFASLWKSHIKPKEKDEGEVNIGDEIDKATKPSQQTEAKKDGTEPDGTGPHGRGAGPGKGKADGTGMKKKKDDDEDEKEKKKDDDEDEKEKKKEG